MAKEIKLILFFMFLTTIISGCNPVIYPTATNLPQISTITPGSPQANPTQDIHPTMTYSPVLPESEAREKIINLLKTNGGCRLPCFWGITPGYTSSQELVSRLYEFHDIGGIKGIEILEGDVMSKISISWNYSDDTSVPVKRLGVDFRFYEYNQDEILKGNYNNPYYVESMYPSLPFILSAYGQPDDVYVYLDLGKAQGLEDIYLLFLDYTKSGWISIFNMPVIQEGDIYKGCPRYASITFRMWSPGDIDTAEEYGFADGYGHSIPIEDASPWTLEEFYDLFIDPLNTKCFETPMSVLEN